MQIRCKNNEVKMHLFPKMFFGKRCCFLYNYLEINRTVLENNAKNICEYVKTPVIGVVKCDGYGMSFEAAVSAWRSAGVGVFAVSKPEEALELRSLGVTEDILLLAPVANESVLCEMIDKRIILTVTGIDCARFYSENSSGENLRVHVAVDVGMGRFGVKWTDHEQLKSIYNVDFLVFEGIFSHFSKSYEKDYFLSKLQLERFMFAAETLERVGIEVGVRHIANSLAALRFPETRLDAVRIGSALIGKLCSESPIELQIPFCLKATVADIKYLQVGDTVGYGSFCKLKRKTKAAVVAVGYSDGFGYEKFPDNLSVIKLLMYFLRCIKRRFIRPCVSFRDKRLPLIGRVGNQYTLFDAGETDLSIGDTVVVEVPALFPHQRKKSEYL